MNYFPPENEAKIQDLLDQMTSREKIGQLNQLALYEEHTGPDGQKGDVSRRMELVAQGDVGSALNLVGAQRTREVQKLAVENSRLGVPLLFAYDVIHGYHTMFPIPLAEAATWNLSLIKQTSRIAAIEASAAGLHWTFAPMVDVSRDARWGRVMEGAGEDPHLGAKIAEARIQGFQGMDLLELDTIAACAKHFAGYGFVESGKDYNTVNIDRNTLHNAVLPPFQAAAKAGVATFMNGFTSLNGVPVTIDRYLQSSLLKGQWLFNGLVVSDWNSIGELVAHGVVTNLGEAAALAIEAGSDIDMEGSAYLLHLENLVQGGKVHESLIDDAVTRVLRLKFALGLFDDPYRYCDVQREQNLIGAHKHHQVALEIAEESIILLKNENQLLPLDGNEDILLLGPLADDKDTPLGNWRAQAKGNTAVSVLEGLRKRCEGKIRHIEGCGLVDSPFSFSEAYKLSKQDEIAWEHAANEAKLADTVILVLGETANMSGEARSRSDIGLPGQQREFLQKIWAVNQNLILVAMSGRPLELSWEAAHIPAILLSLHAGQMAGDAIASVLLGKQNPSGKLPMSLPRSVGQLPIYHNHLPTGRPTSAADNVFFTHHNDIDPSPLFPFGYGLSYSTFAYSELNVAPTATQNDQSLHISVLVTNTGMVAGSEVVQLYIRDKVCRISRPVKELKGFEKIRLEPQQSQRVEFELNMESLGYLDSNGTWFIEPGEFEVMVGGNSHDLLTAKFELL